MNRFIRFQYNDKVLPFNNDYGNVEVSSLESALEPVLSQVDQLNHFIQKAKQYRHYPSEHGLTEDESAAVYLYTDDWGDQSLNQILNQTLHLGDRTALIPWLSFLKLLTTALEKLPKVTTTIWRGLPIDMIEKLKDNEKLVLCSITSCSSSFDIIKHLLNNNVVLCSIKPLNGKNVHGYTPYKADYEVLLLPGIHLHVKTNDLSNNDIQAAICLEEINEIDDVQGASNDIEMLDVNNPTNEENMKNGKSEVNEIEAVITFTNGDRYKLTYHNGKKQGYETYYSTNEEKVKTIKEQDADDKANGEGICVFKNGDRFVGTFERGNRHGHGILLSNENGKVHAGNWYNDEITNQGLKIMSNSDPYGWTDEKNNQRWYGAYSDDKGNKYIGNIVDGKAHGLGVRIWTDNSRYEGNFENDKKHGFGIYYFADRGQYMGQWSNDEINGQGKLKWKSGTLYKGNFSNGKRHGQGKLTLSNGKMQEGNWKEDKYTN